MNPQLVIHFKPWQHIRSVCGLLPDELYDMSRHAQFVTCPECKRILSRYPSWQKSKQIALLGVLS